MDDAKKRFEVFGIFSTKHMPSPLLGLQIRHARGVQPNLLFLQINLTPRTVCLVNDFQSCFQEMLRNLHVH